MKLAMTTAAALLLSAAPALAQEIDQNHKHAWGENVGWLNFADAGDPPGSLSVRVHAEFLEGFVWAENAGWINLGNGGGPYTNNDGANFGVNRDPFTGHLSGYAWGENVGWINFSGGGMADPANPARVEAGRLRGYAWGENIGWINLDDDEHYVALACPADFNGDGAVNTLDVLAFLNAYTAGDPKADFNGDTVINTLDVLAFLNAYTAGCP